MTIEEFASKSAQNTVIAMVISLLMAIGCGSAWALYPNEPLGGLFFGLFAGATLILWIMWRWFLKAAAIERKHGATS